MKNATPMLLLTWLLLANTAIAESPELAALPLFEEGAGPAIKDADSCGGEIKDLSSLEIQRLVEHRQLRPAGPVRVKPSTMVRKTRRSYDKALNPDGAVELVSVTRTRTTSRSYEYLDDDGLLQKVDINCSLSCSGMSCSSSGCTPGSAANCTAHTCIHAIGTPPCSGTCTKNSSSRPNPDNKH